MIDKLAVNRAAGKWGCVTQAIICGRRVASVGNTNQPISLTLRQFVTTGFEDMRKILHLLRCRWRAVSAVALGMVAGHLALGLGVRPATSALIGWDCAALWFVVTTYHCLLFDDAETMRRRADLEDENRGVFFSLILSAVAASLAAIVMALREGKGGSTVHDAIAPGVVLFLSASTLILSWLVVQGLFTLHYAHRWIGGTDKDRSMAGGIQFVGDPPTTYRDFLYVAVCIGATSQGSDFGIANTRFRNLVTIHAILSFLFNTMVLALGINIIASLIS